MLAEAASDVGEFRYSASNNISYMYQVYCSYILLFKNSTGQKNFMSPQLLQEGLTALVRTYYQPVAGWFDVRADDIDVVYYSDKFNDPPFSTQTLDIDSDELASHVRRSNEELLVPSHPSSWISQENRDIPMFLAKATYLRSNDAIAIGVSYHHSLMDGSAFW
ncbi:hypothetical protein GGI02_003358, partial [Coemansia sp. RSA 2322]